MHTAENADVETSLPLLVTHAKEGDYEVWEEIVARCTSIVDISVRKVIDNYHLAEEVRQDVFIYAFEKIGTLREEAAFPQWLRTIARGMAINRITRGPREQAIDWIEDVGQKNSDTPENPVDILIMREDAENLHAAMRTLKPMDYNVLHVFHIQEKDLKETADALSAPMGTIKRRLHVARRRLGETLERTFFS